MPTLRRKAPVLLVLSFLLACAGGDRPRPPLPTKAEGRDPAGKAAPSPPAPSAALPTGEGAPSPPAAVIDSPPPELVPPAETAEPLPARPAEPLPPPPSVDLPATVRIRVGLASDLPAVTLPCCEGEVTLATGDGGAASPLPVVSPVHVEPLATGGRQFWRLQVAALKDEERARELAERLAREHEMPADAHFDAGVDLFRVRLGRFASREAAQIAARRVAPSGGSDSWVVSEGAALQNPALRVSQAGRTFTVQGRWLALQASPDSGIRVDGHRYRDRVLVYLNDRGSLNVINELPLEDYLRGVVPKEMGPEAYPRLESLKAQAVAARTYTLRNLAGFLAEGYDICATPHCQVYGGMDVEHPRSDLAVAETEDQVLVWDGRPIEALYTATCGGHTEDVKVVFPERDEPYLRGVPCLEAGMTKLGAWTRFRSDGELASKVEERYPGLGFRSLEILDRGRSGRVARMRLLGRTGNEEVRGLAIRWLLDLPETLFTVQRLSPAQGKPGWLFSGRGWGHGVGLCQTGAFGMAGQGAGYRQILAHYYQGAQLARVRRNP